MVGEWMAWMEIRIKRVPKLTGTNRPSWMFETLRQNYDLIIAVCYYHSVQRPRITSNEGCDYALISGPTPQTVSGWRHGQRECLSMTSQWTRGWPHAAIIQRLAVLSVVWWRLNLKSELDSRQRRTNHANVVNRRCLDTMGRCWHEQFREYGWPVVASVEHVSDTTNRNKDVHVLKG